MRKLPDGTTQMPPAVLGAYTFDKGLQNLNVFWHTPEGKPAIYSRISTYRLSGNDYTETVLLTAIDDGIGKPPTYNTKEATKNTPVTREHGRLVFKLPFDEVSVVLEGDKFTATLEGQFVDYWERVH